MKLINFFLFESQSLDSSLEAGDWPGVCRLRPYAERHIYAQIVVYNFLPVHFSEIQNLFNNNATAKTARIKNKNVWILHWDKCIISVSGPRGQRWKPRPCPRDSWSPRVRCAQLPCCCNSSYRRGAPPHFATRAVQTPPPDPWEKNHNF